MYISLYQPIIIGFLLCSIEVPPRFEDKRSINFSTITGIPWFFWGAAAASWERKLGRRDRSPFSQKMEKDSKGVMKL